mmetsp:Transcript_1483/g.1624  ORF Transcript_1483/g.1624 Transcript_1483/m.1624 type:complete len:238 (-) Transcript_1483:43-756(-)
MKLIAFALLFALALSAATIGKDGSFNFEQDSNSDSPIGVFMKGRVNPRDDADTNVETFLRLAEQMIPLASSVASDKAPGKLQYTRQWCFGNIGDAISVCINANAELWVGWRVGHTGETGLYNVTYTPFSFLRGGFNASASSYPAEVSYGGFFSIYDIQVPINLLLAETQICYSGTFNLYPTSAYTAINTNLLQCERSIPDRTDWYCDRVHGAEFRHLQFDITDGFFSNFLPHTCINF